jgi:hypothetical protein
MLEALREYVEHRLRVIQETRNFNPSLGAEQVRDFPELRKDYARFDELKRIVTKFGLEVTITYNASRVPIAPRESCVYFAQKQSTTEWKIGFSTNAHKRVCSLNTGSSGTLVNRYTVPGGRELEQSIHGYLSHYHIKGRSKEWFDLDHKEVKALIGKIKLEGYGFLPNT